MKRLLLACLLLQDLFLQKVDAATIRSGTIHLQQGWDYTGFPSSIAILGDGFSVVIPLVLTSSSNFPTENCCHKYGSTQLVDFSLVGANRNPKCCTGTNGFLFNSQAYDGYYLWGLNYDPFGSYSGENSLFQRPARPSQLRIVGTPIVFPNGPKMPTEIVTNQELVLTGTFELTGSLCGYLTGSGTKGPQPCVFDMPTVYGRGTYAIKTRSSVYQGPDLPGYWIIDKASFIPTFTDPSADVPEPGPMAMLAVGVAGLGLLRRAKSQSKRPAKKEKK